MPALLLLLALIVYPLLHGVAVSMFDTNLLNRWEFVGTRYLVETFTSARVWSTLGTTGTYAFLVVAGNLLVGTSLALLLNTSIRGRAWFRTALVLPWLFPEVVVALVWKWILNPLYGPLNHVLGLLGYSGEPIAWLDTPHGAMTGIVVASIWKGYPLVMIMVLAGLQSIPAELYEAVALDGAGKIRAFWHVTLPALRPVLLVVVILETVWYIKQFTIPWIMTSGGPVGATRLISLDIYQNAFQSFQFGRAAATAVLVFVVCLVISFVYRKVIRDDSGR
ncbi:sugar ABC transporter permease [Cellulomonas sp. zg-ZUI40]|nr:sugar ABC transporter permease [Cellulomonas dongxiuzhuiae]